ncbi:TetR/AcrR family transcriptional regulator [Rhizobium sp. PL01]|uniref:TetR/AcrR family transcriptional regulator n=1 Tax=Rhizobium sp. PL01 TaxID=3085631 RepID=UPI002981C244|nr:TetR/AcrR family transcriptional regulator [Rhizobium sp. PL01]MDW5318183.1 TetR/AcrR family transcriptional regulator [Rhizobium sp. PL01]
MVKRDPLPATRQQSVPGKRGRVASLLTPRERFDALPPDRQAGLLDPAEDEFSAHGYEQASLNRILERAGLSKGQAYYYVKDKAALYLLVVERAFARLAATIGPLPATAKDPDAYWKAIQLLFRRVPVVLSQDTKLADLARAIYPTSAAANAALEPLLARLLDQLKDHVRSGQSFRAVRDDVPADFLAAGIFGFIARLDRWFAMSGHSLDTDEASRLNDAAVAMCRAMVSPPTEPSESENGRRAPSPGSRHFGRGLTS